MRKLRSSLLTLLLVNIAAIASQAQTTISGKVINSTSSEAVPAVSVTVKGSGEGTFTDDRGVFKITVARMPVVLLISSVGYEMQEVNVSNAAEQVNVSFKPSNKLGQEVVISATRTSQRIMESPVSIERISTATIRNAPAVTYYDILGNLKGVDMVTSSLTFKTPTTRGFSGSGNLRVNQLVDGMDNQAPGLNFSVGSVVGLTELDVDNVELLPGASSALYGPGGMNGTILISSKNPFKYQGFSFQIKEGVMNVDNRFRSASNYINGAVRFAHKVSDKFAFKVGGEYIKAKDWFGYDYRNYARTGTDGFVKDGDRATDPAYDGVNVYGDETQLDLRQLVFPSAAESAPFLKNFLDTLNGGRPINVTRTGYAESEVINPNTISFKLSGALHYKISAGTEAILAGHWGSGNTVYTGSDRYSLRDIRIGQYKLELNNKNWMVRAYTTQENAGESYNATATLGRVIGAVNPYETWLGVYGPTYIGARLSGATDADAHTAARAAADGDRKTANDAAFKRAFDSVRMVPISQGGGLFVDRTNLYNVEGQYNLSQYTSSFADILVGGNFKRYVLNSERTLFAEPDGKTGINEVGAYVQATKRFFDDVLKLTVSGRYDKNQNFKGRFTPRVTAMVKVAENNNIRLSYQTAYRFPSTQQQWIDLIVGGGVRLVGGVKYFDENYGFSTKPTFYLDNVSAYQKQEFKPESVNSYEIGYKGLLADDKLLVDVYSYYGIYQNFITRRLIIQPTSGGQQELAADLQAGKPATSLGEIFSIPVNTTSKVKTLGWGIGLDYRLPKNFQVSTNASSDDLRDVPPGFKTYFSTPKYRMNASVGNTGFAYKNRMGFNVTWRWQDGFEYESDFSNGYINPIHTVDAQISYRIPSAKTIIKIGATNLLNEYYTNGLGNSVVGGLYYVSLGYNVF
ncbi:MAG TPA: TonB-dependent receptor [Ferruginibacter sp.]|nr:TonB-dependent receptor [Ferruginibacter sp.]HMP20142.1 TonB-dependent receptor [Ferruginibacter sp.]